MIGFFKTQILIPWIMETQTAIVCDEFSETLEEDADDFSSACTKLSNYFNPMKDQHVAVYHFREASQGSDTIDQFVTRLRTLAKDCGFSSVDEDVVMLSGQDEL